jgi:hypothetical protein
MPPCNLRPLSRRLARHWLLTLILAELAVFASGYFYFTTMHALESFDTGSCIPLAVGSSGNCVSSLQKLLKADSPYPTIAVDGNFGKQTKQTVIKFQSDHHLTKDGKVGSKTASAINQFSPRPSMLSYAAGFANSKLALSAKLCLTALAAAMVIICLLLRAARAGPNRMLRIRCSLIGFFAALITANSDAIHSLMSDAHVWVAQLLCIILAGLTAALLWLIGEIFQMSTFSAATNPLPQEIPPRIRDWYGF